MAMYSKVIRIECLLQFLVLLICVANFIGLGNSSVEPLYLGLHSRRMLQDGDDKNLAIDQLDTIQTIVGSVLISVYAFGFIFTCVAAVYVEIKENQTSNHLQDSIIVSQTKKDGKDKQNKETSTVASTMPQTVMSMSNTMDGEVVVEEEKEHDVVTNKKDDDYETKQDMLLEVTVQTGT